MIDHDSKENDDKFEDFDNHLGSTTVARSLARQICICRVIVVHVSGFDLSFAV